MKSRSQILKYASRSSIMDVKIKMGKKEFTFNLNEELQVDENDIVGEMKNQPSYYGYLGLLKVKLQRVVSDLEIEVNKEYAQLYFKYQDDLKEVGNRAEAAKTAKHKVERNPLYIAKCNSWNKAKEDLGIIVVCLESFDQRSRMVQSINANLRQEKI